MFKRSIEIYPGSDDRDKGNGFSSAEMLFILRSDTGAATFAVLTDWLPKHMQQEAKTISLVGTRPRPLDLTLHFPRPPFVPQQIKHDDCPYMDGPCYSTKERAEHLEAVRDILLAEGSEGVWAELERRYREAARILQIQIKDKE